MVGEVAWVGNAERCMRGWTDCSECLVLMPEAEEAVKDHNVCFFLNKMLRHKATKLGKLKLKMGIKNIFC